jgi:hypothetical protein
MSLEFLPSVYNGKFFSESDSSQNTYEGLTQGIYVYKGRRGNSVHWAILHSHLFMRSAVDTEFLLLLLPGSWL